MGQSVTFTATVTANNGTTPTGSVQFAVDGTVLGSPVTLNGSGVAVSHADSSLSAGPHTVTASYSPTGFFVSSTGTLTQQVNSPTLVATTTTISSSFNPSFFGQSVTFTATVSGSGGTPTGTVNFLDGGTTIGSGTLSFGMATFSTATLGVGTHTITASYTGDHTFQGSVSSTPVTQRVQQDQTTTLLTSSPNPAKSGAPVTFTATISVQGPGTTAAANPTGSVTFTDSFNGQTTTLGTPTLTSADNGVITLTLTNLGVGLHTVTATYSGDGNFRTSTSPNVLQSITAATTVPTTTTITSSANPSTSGQSITFTATVAPSSGGGTPTGTVEFFIDGNPFGNHVSLNGGVAVSQAISTLSVGTHTITVNYSGDSSFAPNSSNPFTQTVNATAPTLTDGTILVATSPSSSHSSAPAGVIGVDPSSGAQFLVSTGGMFSQPMHITEDPSGHVLYVSDLTATGAGAIIEVDLNNNDQQSLVAKGQYINAPTGIVYFSGHIYVVDQGNGSSVAPNVVDITPSNGKQNLLTSGGSLDKPVGVARANAPDLFVLDEAAFGTGAIFQLNVNTDALTVFSKGGGLFNNPIDLAVDQNGNLIVTNQNGTIVEVDRATGAATLLNSQTFGPGITSGTINQTSGIIYLGAMTVGSSAGQIFSLDPSNGNHGSLSQGNNLDRVEGVYIYVTPGGGAAAAPNGSSPASFVFTPIQGANASLMPATARSSSSDSASQSQSVPVQTFSQLLSPPADSAAGNGTRRPPCPRQPSTRSLPIGVTIPHREPWGMASERRGRPCGCR